MLATPEQSQIANRKAQMIAWQGWTLRVPEDWNPVKVEGDADRGLLLLADLERPRLGLRWRKLSERVDGERWAQQSLKEEVGLLASEEAKELLPDAAWKGGRLYIEPEPPGRDVWAGVSATSGRGIQVVYHAKTRDRRLAAEILPTLHDAKADAPRSWAIFDLACQTPAGWALQWYRFHAGDVALAFTRGRSNVTVRQIGPASLALARQPLEEWMKQQDKAAAKLYRPVSKPEPSDLTLRGTPLSGLTAKMAKRKRLFWAIGTRPQVRLGVHDTDRNRLLIVQGDDEANVRQWLALTGTAPGEAGAV
jgi:hypothetical protein